MPKGKKSKRCGIGKIYDSKIKSCRKMSKSEKKATRSYAVKKGLSKAAGVAAMGAGVNQFKGGKSSKSFKKQAAGLAALSGVAKGLETYSDLRASQRRKPKKKKKK
tara:strand:+ start:68 stop:385 length:318 start_codon:yes stop_codon:yes gene_type:complete